MHFIIYSFSDFKIMDNIFDCWQFETKISKICLTNDTGKHILLWNFCLRPKGQRPKNYSSCCCSWIFGLIYALSTSTILLNILNYHSTYLSIYLSIILHSIYLSINPSCSIFFCQSFFLNRPLVSF